ncbi:hypothetical protein EK21DRAFT_108678 [Setomelanomma holmii]|uniref:Uncharacterized protein n=1 Tax=Setomelanomma holmii TaxID=210430 RepID=A0A9P4HGL9_9PLEO|nr:hypothetical protein EK21DRAFT_108678 [Setomelanomma holmii]
MNPAHQVSGPPSHSNQGNTLQSTPSSTPSSYPFGFGSAPVSARAKHLDYHHVKPAELARIINLLLSPPNQPSSHPVPFIVINMTSARRTIGLKHFEAKPQDTEEDRERFYELGLKKITHGKKASPKNALWYKDLEYGLPMTYWMALCGERKEGCEGDELCLLREEWKMGWRCGRSGVSRRWRLKVELR